MYSPDFTTSRAAQHQADLLRDAAHSRHLREARPTNRPHRRVEHGSVLRAAVDRLRRAVTATRPSRPVTG
jgi:hypothetical protein